MGDDMSLSPGFDPAARTIVFRAFSADNEWFEPGRTVREFEQYMAGQQKRIFVERLRQQGSVKDPSPKTVIRRGDEIVVSGRPPVRHRRGNMDRTRSRGQGTGQLLGQNAAGRRQ